MTSLPLNRPANALSLRLSHVVVGVMVALVLAGVASISVIAAGALYIPLFVLLTLWKREFGMALTFSLAPLVNDLAIGGPVHVSIGEFSLMLLFVLCMASQLGGRERLRMGPALIPISFYVLFCVISTAANWDPGAITPILQMCIYLFCAVCVFASFSRNPERLTVILDLAIFVAAILAAGALISDYSLMHFHKNSWGASMGTATVIAVERWLATKSAKKRRHLAFALALLVACLFFSLSRGGWVSAIVGCFVILAMRGRFRALIKLAALLIPLVIVMWYLLPAQLQDYAVGLDTSRRNIEARWDSIDMALSVFKAHPVLGVGVQLRKEMDATNLVMVTLAETGIQGLLAFIAVHVTVLFMVWRDRKYLDRTNPLYSILLLGGALIMARLSHGLVDHYWSRGPILQAWSAVGMATAVHYKIKRSRRTQS